jgi:hypothetical protein
MAAVAVPIQVEAGKLVAHQMVVAAQEAAINNLPLTNFYMSKRLVIVLFIAASVISVSSSHAQGLLDGLRLGADPVGSNPRSMAMGNAMIAAANDYSALAFNPGAITILDHSEFSLSLFHKIHNSTADFLGTTTSDDISQTIPYSFGYAAPVPTERGHLAFGMSLDRVVDFTSTYKFKAVNPNSSFLNTKGFVDDPGYGGNLNDYIDQLNSDNIAWNSFLTYNVDSAHPFLSTPFTGNLQQSGTVTQEGGINAFRIGGGIDVAENIAVGATLNFYFGSYDYHRVLTETDINNVFSDTDHRVPNGFQSATVTDNRTQTIGGFSAKFGLYAAPDEHLSVGLTFETPIFYGIDDQFSRSVVAHYNFDVISDSKDMFPLPPIIVNSYSITTPLKLAGGISYTNWGLTLAASAEFVDYSQLDFSSDVTDVSDLKDASRDQLHGVLNYNLGVEYLIKPIGVLIRGGYSMQPSPYKGDPAEYGTKSFSGGLGILLSQSAMLEISYRNSSYRTSHTLYNDYTVNDGTANGSKPVSAIIDQDNVTTDQVALGFSFRF